MINENEIRIARHCISYAMVSGADAVRVSLSKSVMDGYTLLNGELDKVTHSADRSIYLYIFSDGRYGTFSTNRLEEKELEEFPELPFMDRDIIANRGNWASDASADYGVADYGCSIPERAYEAAPPLEAPMPAPMSASKPCSLEDWLSQTDAGFSETLLKLIDKTGKKDSEIYKKANLSKQHFSKIRNNPDYKPTKATALSLALALELDLEETRDLIGRAGYALTNSSKFDLIVRYFIEQRRYNVVEINCVLFEHDQNLLGS